MPPVLQVSLTNNFHPPPALPCLAPAAAASTAVAKPRLVSPPPFFLTNFVVALACKLTELRPCLETALHGSNVDYEYNADKWKAKCYLYRPRGFCAFVMRAFSSVSEGGNETYLLELQRRKASIRCACGRERAGDGVRRRLVAATVARRRGGELRQ